MDIEDSEKPEIAAGLYDDGAKVDMLAKSKADRSEAISECEDVFSRFDIFNGIFIDVINKDDSDEERAFTSAIEPLPCDQREGDLGRGRPSDEGKVAPESRNRQCHLSPGRTDMRNGKRLVSNSRTRTAVCGKKPRNISANSSTGIFVG